MRRPHICIGKLAYPLPQNLTLEAIESLPTAVPEEWVAKYNFSLNNTARKILPDDAGGLGEHAWIIAAYSIVFLLAVLGNSLVIATLVMNKRMGTVTNYFLLSLAVSDLMMAILCIPTASIAMIKREFILGDAMCKLMGYLMAVSVAVSTFTMVAISLERYYAICRPLQARGWQTKSHACKVIIGIWVFSFLVMIPMARFTKIQLIPIADVGKCKYGCRTFFPDQVSDHNIARTSLSHKSWYVFQLTALLIIPGIVMTVAYGCICKTIYSGFRFHSAQNSGSIAKKKRDRVPESQKLVEPATKGTNVSNAEAAIQDSSSRLGVENPTSSATPSPKTFRNGIKGILKQKSQHRGSNEPYSDESRKNETRKQLEAKKKVVEMLIIIVLLFFICWTPTFVANVWKSFDPLMAQNKLYPVPIAIFGILRYASICVNPVVYCFLNKRFRDAFMNIFCMCCGCLPDRCRPQSTEATRQPVTQNTMLTSNNTASHM